MIMHRTDGQEYEHSLGSAISAIEGRWKAPVITALANSIIPLRFNQIIRSVPGISPRLLTVQLRELERDGIIEREVLSAAPKRVQYGLTQRGLSLIPIFELLVEWDQVQNYSGIVSLDTGRSEGGLNA